MSSCINPECIGNNCICTNTEKKCSDGTPYSQCSATKPKFCAMGSENNAILINNCDKCSCPINEECQLNGDCANKPANIEINNKSGSVDDIIDFRITIEKPQTDIDAFGFSVFYNSSILEYVDKYNGALIEGFDFFDANDVYVDEGFRKLIVGGFTTQNIIEKDVSGELVKLQFKVIGCEDAVLELKYLVDDMKNWNTAVGNFNCE